MSVTTQTPVAADLGAFAYSLGVNGFDMVPGSDTTLYRVSGDANVYVHTDIPGGGVLVIRQNRETGLNEWRVMFNPETPRDAVTAFVVNT